MFYYVMKL